MYSVHGQVFIQCFLHFISFLATCFLLLFEPLICIVFVVYFGLSRSSAGYSTKGGAGIEGLKKCCATCHVMQFKVARCQTSSHFCFFTISLALHSLKAVVTCIFLHFRGWTHFDSKRCIKCLPPLLSAHLQISTSSLCPVIVPVTVPACLTTSLFDAKLQGNFSGPQLSLTRCGGLLQNVLP
jgi:hypothetical protein